MLNIETNQVLPRHPTYDSDAMARAFWRLTFHTGRNYVDGLDALGNPVVPPHEREKEGYLRRKRLTKPRNHAGPLIRRYNDHVFRRDVERDLADPAYAVVVADADGKGTTISDFFKRCLLQAQIERESYTLPDSNAPADGTVMTQAQATEAGVRAFLRRVSPDAVVWWRDHEGMLVEAIVVMVDADGEAFARQFDATSFRDITFKKVDVAPGQNQPSKPIVASVGPLKPHNCGGCPLVRLRPLFTGDDEQGESQIAPMSQSQQAITNLLSLITEEIFNVTFSQVVATGVSADQVRDVFMGNNRVICLPNAAGNFKTIGADPAQAATIAAQIMDEQRELYRIAGVDAGSSTQTGGAGNPESGIAKAFKHNDLSANLSALANAVQQAENLSMRRLFTSMGKTPPADVKYPKEFDLPALGDELSDVIRAITVPQLPKVLKQKHVAQFAARNFELDDAEQAELATQLKTIGDEPTDEPLAGRTPGT